LASAVFSYLSSVCAKKLWMDSGKIHIGFWVDADFGISEGVDFTAISFIKNPEFIKCLKNYLKARAPDRYSILHYHIAMHVCILTCIKDLSWMHLDTIDYMLC
jgi:hypothetical protein